MNEVTEQGKTYKAFYYDNEDDKNVEELINLKLGTILETYGFACKNHKCELFVKVGDYKTSLNENEDTTHKLQKVQRGNWIIIEFYQVEKNNGELKDIIANKVKVVSPDTMYQRYRSLIPNYRITKTEMEYQAVLFEDSDSA